MDEKALERYRAVLESEAERLGASVGEPKWEDDDWAAKLDVLLRERVPVVSFTFGCPDKEVIAALQKAGSFVMVTVTSREEACMAAEAGANALCVQGEEAGGHRASFGNDPKKDGALELFPLLTQVRAEVRVPLAAAGGIMDGRGIAAALKAGASAVQLGTAFLRCPESGAHPLHKQALADPRFAETAVTRAFTGRPARGLVNRVYGGVSRHGAGGVSACAPYDETAARCRRQGGRSGRDVALGGDRIPDGAGTSGRGACRRAEAGAGGSLAEMSETSALVGYGRGRFAIPQRCKFFH